METATAKKAAQKRNRVGKPDGTQQRITDIFSASPAASASRLNGDDFASNGGTASSREVSKNKRKRTVSGHFRSSNGESSKRPVRILGPPGGGIIRRSWKTELGTPPAMGTTQEEKVAWLAFMKRKWDFQRQQRARLRYQIKSTDHTTENDFSATPFSQTAENIWQIIQLMETTQPGVFNLWILVNGEVKKFKLRMPRIFYINQRNPKTESNGETYQEVHRILPRANRVYYLYEYRVDEEVFQQQINELQAELSAPQVEGIYETQVPLSFRLFAQVGNACKSIDLENQDEDTFDFADLESVASKECGYLEQGRYNFIYLYHYTQDTRCILALFQSHLQTAQVLVADRNEESYLPDLDSMYATERRKRKENANERDLPSADIHFMVESKNSLQMVYQSMDSTIKACQNRIRGPTMIVFESPLETRDIQSLMPALDEFPLIKLRVVSKDRLYSTLDWHRVGIRHMLNGYLNSGAVLKASLELSRYLNIPVGNLPTDPTLFGGDLFLARQLWKQNCALWCSPTDRPDFGGKELDDNRLVTDSDDFKNLNVNKSGLYDSICLELDVASVAVTAFLQAQRIRECEGVTSADGFDMLPHFFADQLVGGQSSYRIVTAYDETALCAGAFRALKTVVHQWIRDIAVHRSVFADNQIIHFYRWLCTSSSLLYDPALKRSLNAYMKKLLLLLIAELKESGATVVYSSLTSVIVCTQKSSNNDAMANVNNVMKQLRRKDLFATLDITIKRGWKVLMWMDPANFGGIKLCIPQNCTAGTIAITDTDTDTDTPVVDMNWNLMHFLPTTAGCQINFKMLIAGYIVLLYQSLQKRESEESAASSSPPPPDQLDTTVRSDWANASSVVKNDDPAVQFRRDLISGELTEKLFSIVDKIKRKVSTSVRTASSSGIFPIFPGTHLKPSDPALEFVKAICKILSLDHKIEEQITLLREDLMRLIGVSDFADEAQWMDPCLSHVLNEVICRNCNYCRDLDLCRDPYLNRENLEEGERPVWRCTQCQAPYNIGEIETTLIKHLNSLLMAYILQDLKCSKCKQIKQGNMNPRCECGGQYECTSPAQPMVALKLKTFTSIANYYNMKNLHEALHWAIVLNPKIKRDLQ